MSIDLDNFFEDTSQTEASSISDSNKDCINKTAKDADLSGKSVEKRTEEISKTLQTQPSTPNTHPPTLTSVTFKRAGSKIIASPIVGKSAKDLQDAVDQGNVGFVSVDNEGNPTFRVPANFERQGITQVEYPNSDGTTTTHTSVKFETLSDKELAAVKAQIKARIVYLKLSDPENKDKKDDELKYLQTLLKFVESEEALRNKNPDDFMRLNGKQMNTISKMEKKWSQLRARLNANQEIREARAEEKEAWVRVIVMEKIIKNEVLFTSILAELILKAETAKEKHEEGVNGSKVKTVDYVSISPTINKNPRRVFVNMGSLLIRFRSI